MSTISEERPLLRKTDDVKDTEGPQNRKYNNSPLHYVVRTLLTIIFVFGIESGGLTKNQYIYKWFEENTVTNGTTLNFTGTKGLDPCGGNISAKKEKTDQSDAARWTLYFSLCEHGIAIPLIILYGTYSDVIGRKPLMLISTVGYCLQYIGKSFIVFKKLPIYYFFVPYSIAGLAGCHYTFYMALMASVADKTESNQKRTLGLILAECIIGIGVCTAQIETGYVIKEYGYLYPMVGAAGLFMICIPIIIFGVSDTRTTKTATHFTICKSIKTVFSMYHSKKHLMLGNIMQFNLAMLSFLIASVPSSSRTSLTLLYQLRSPFCWDSETIGWYGFGTDIVQYILSMFAIRALQISIRDGYITIMALLSAIAFCVITGLAKTSIMLYIGSAAGFLSAMAAPLLRAFLSKMMDKNVQGAVFGNLYVIENICHMFGSTVFNEIYASTQSFMAGFVYMTMGAAFLISMLIFMPLTISKPVKTKEVNS